MSAPGGTVDRGASLLAGASRITTVTAAAKLMDRTVAVRRRITAMMTSGTQRERASVRARNCSRGSGSLETKLTTRAKLSEAQQIVNAFICE
jgi:hypothetical protein